MQFRSIVSVASAVLYVASTSLAQNPPPPVAPPPPGTPPPSAAAASAASTGQTFKQEELDSMLAPIALYPDALLSQVLMATTYPLEVVEAARWRKENAGLKDKALEDALGKQPWDESVKSLTAFPEVLDRLNKDLAWTQKLGDAFLGQQAQVMDTIQNLRAKAEAAGNLKSNEQQKVEVQKQDAKTYIVIEPTNPQVVYVPTYQPAVVYGSWWWPSYPPYYPPYWTAPGAAFVNGFFWGAGIAAGAALWGGWNWNNHNVNINVNRYNNFNRTNINNSNWSHNVNHRGAVPYRDAGARARYGGATDRQAAQARDQFRGREGSLGGGGLNDRAGLNEAQRGAANRAGGAQGGLNDRAGAANRGTGGSGSRPDLGVSSRGSAERNSMGSRGGDTGNRGAFGGGNGAQTRSAADRGHSSMGASNSMRSSGGAARGGGGGGARGGGGGGGGRRR